MPFLLVHTNAKLKDNNPEQFVSAATNLLGEELRKPHQYIVVAYDYNPHIAFAGSCDNKGALVEMKSIGFGSKTGLAKLLSEFLFDRLEGIELNNINIEFVDMAASDVAIGGHLLG